jgi:hypothetical protein
VALSSRAERFNTSRIFVAIMIEMNVSGPHLQGAKLYIAPMKGDLHPFIAAEIVKKKREPEDTTELLNHAPTGAGIGC